MEDGLQSNDAQGGDTFLRSKLVNTELLKPLEALSLNSQHRLQDYGATSVIDEQISQHIDDEKYQGFFVRDIAMMVKFIDSSQLTEVPQIFRLPNSPDWFLGYSNLRGNLIPVFDLALYFGLEYGVSEQKKPNTKLLVLLHDDESIGVLVDDLPSRVMKKGGHKAHVDIAPKALKPHLKSAYLLDETVWFELNAKSIAEQLESAI